MPTKSGCLQNLRSVYFGSMDHVSVENFRSSLGDFLDRVYFRHESFVVTRNGTPFVLLAPVSPGKPPADQINARAMRKQMSHFLGQVHFQEINILIVRRGKPTAILTNAFEREGNDLLSPRVAFDAAEKPERRL